MPIYLWATSFKQIHQQKPELAIYARFEINAAAISKILVFLKKKEKNLTSNSLFSWQNTLRRWFSRKFMDEEPVPIFGHFEL